MVKKSMHELAFEIRDLLDEYEVSYMTAIYFEGNRLSQLTTRNWVLELGKKGSDYTEYANDDTITMTFEGGFYEVINYGVLPSLKEEFSQLLENNGYYYELGDAWNLSLYKS